MKLRIKWLVQVVLITGVLGSMAFAEDILPSPTPPLLSGGWGKGPQTPHNGGEGKDGGEVKIPDVIKIPDVVATINGTIISRQDLEARVAEVRSVDPIGFDAMGLEENKLEITRTLDDMILKEVIHQEAVSKNIVVTEEEIEMSLENLRRHFSSEEAFQKAFTDANITIPEWRERTRKMLMGIKLEEMVMDFYKFTDSEIEEYYEKNKKDINKDSVKVRHILVKTEEEAQKIIEEFDKDKDFEGLAKKYSEDPYTKEKGGDLGWYGKGELLREVEEAAYTLSPGQISGPVKSQFGYHIIRLDEKKVASEQTIEDHREHVRSILRKAKWQKLRLEWVKTLLNKTVVWKWTP